MHRLKSIIRGRGPTFLIVVLSMVLGASLMASLGDHESTAYAVDQKTANQQQRSALYDLQGAFTSLVDEVSPSVVSILSERAVETRGVDPGFEEFFKDLPFPMPMPDMPSPDREAPDTPNRRTLRGQGTGVIIRADGYILTNDHVVGGADRVTVKLKDGREFPGTVTRDTRSDLAVIKISAKGLPAAKLGDSSKVKVGSWAIAIGSPFGLEQTLTVGVISGVGRQEAVPDETGGRFYPNLIQTDASINPGNSGGPLVNIDGEVVGINTLIRSGGFSGGNIGIGFAIPVNTAKFVLNQLITHGKVVRGYAGLVPTDLNPRSADRYGVKTGALVQSVEAGSPADQAGIEVEDIIVEFDGKAIENQIALRDVIAATQPGKEASVVVVRNKARKSLRMKVSEAPSTEQAQADKDSETKVGISVSNITPQVAEQYRVPEKTQGVLVTKVAPGSSAMQSGLAAGMVITRANDKPVRTVADFSAATSDLKSGDSLRLVVKAKERTMLIEYTLD